MKYAFAAALLTSGLLSSGAIAGLQAPVKENKEAEASQPQEKLDPPLKNLEEDRSAAIFVRFKDQLFKRGGDFETFCKEHTESKRRELRKDVIATLKSKSEASWNKVKDAVATIEKSGGINTLKRFWVVNGFACDATLTACQELAKLDEVEFVYRQTMPAPYYLHKNPAQGNGRKTPEKTLNLHERILAERKAGKDPAIAYDKIEIPWNLGRIKAGNVWIDEGVRGEGVVIGVIDSGLTVTPALTSALWHNAGESVNGEDDDGNGYIDDVFGYDFSGSVGGYILGDRDAKSSHGTICAGIIASRPYNSNNLATGVAPAARLMILAKGALETYEYALNHGADVLSMSYMLINIEVGNYRGVYRLAHEHMTAAGIVSAGGAGNFAQQCPEGKQICIPKDIPCVIAAAGVGEKGRRPAFSSMGPCYWEGVVFYDDYPKTAPLIKPDVAALNKDFPVWVSEPSANAQRSYTLVSKEDGAVLVIGPQGNSFAGPHVAGLAALMLSADPDLPAWEVKRIMEETCFDIGEKGRDVEFGAGLIDALAAVRTVKKRAGLPLGELKEKNKEKSTEQQKENSPETPQSDPATPSREEDFCLPEPGKRHW
ncbi:MAG: S8 family serine peptidase [Planctomycetes bacterium]|nr:S8 family serine peptidase [Planctomycetota bacterium]NUQ36148.1 S8 family serine peptidase [Planctomycetaceae bacterium]